MLKLDRQKYVNILKDEGLPSAITALHHDKEKMEQVTFEGNEGYQRRYWEHLEQYRQFSRELWALTYTDNPVEKADDLLKPPVSASN